MTRTTTALNQASITWEPKTEWVVTETGSENIGCHCVTPLDDCGCEDCQQRHEYKTIYNKETQTFDEIPVNNIMDRIMVANHRNETVYFQVDDKTKLAGVPVESKEHYHFKPREVSNQMFTIDGIEYLIIYIIEGVG